MATKSYSKHKEFKEFSSSSSSKGIPYTDEQFDMIKSELLPKGSKLDTVAKHGGGREYHYEYKEEKHPSGKYDRKDLRTVEEFTVPPKSPKTESSYYYEREERELPAITAGTRTYNYETSSSTTPGYSRVKNSKAHNVEELDLLLDDLQRDQERQLYKSGYTSDTAESTSFDYKRGTPAKAPSSGYSTLRREERLESSSWVPPPPPATTEIRREEMFREEKHESRVVPSVVSPALPLAVPSTVCTQCHHSTGTLSRSSTPMNKVTTTVKTYTYEVPADQDPASVPLPTHADHQRTYVSTENVHSSSTTGGAGCQHCPHCSGTREYHAKITSDDRTLTNERIVHVSPANETKLVPNEPRNGHGPYGPTSYKYSETSYSSHNLTQSPFPRATTPTPAPQQPPKKLDDLLADFPEARFPTQTDGVVQRKIAVTHESSQAKVAPPASSKNVSGPPVYYPPGHTPFVAKESAGYSSAAMQGGGAYASGRGMYEYESGAKSKSKHSEKKTAVPVCLPLCCAMPCVIM